VGCGLSSFFLSPASLFILAQVCLLVFTSMPAAAGGRFEFIQLNAKSKKHPQPPVAALLPLPFALPFPASSALSKHISGQGSAA